MDPSREEGEVLGSSKLLIWWGEVKVLRRCMVERGSRRAVGRGARRWDRRRRRRSERARMKGEKLLKEENDER